jgi:cytochrome c oxidase subunit 2
MIILFIIIIPSFSLLYYMQPMQNSLLTVKVVGSQWFWTYEYSERYSYSSKNVFLKDENLKNFENFSSWNTFTKNGITEIESYMIQTKDLKLGQFRLLEVDNKLVIPEQVCVRFLVTATDVLHSWSVPSLGIKVDACPGRLNEVTVRVNRCSIYYGQCSEICGVFHGFMPIVVETVSVLDYYKYLFSTSFNSN